MFPSEFHGSQRKNCIKFQESKRTTAETHFQDVRLISFKCDNLKWEPGDVLVIRPENSIEQIDELFAILKEHNFNFGAETVVQLTEIDSGEKTNTVYIQ